MRARATFNHSTGLAVRRDPLTWFPCRVNSFFQYGARMRFRLFLGALKSPFFDAPLFDVLGCKSRFSVKKLAILEKQDKGSKSKSRKVRIQLTLDSSLKGLQRLIQLRGMGRIGKWTPLFERQEQQRKKAWGKKDEEAIA